MTVSIGKRNTNSGWKGWYPHVTIGLLRVNRLIVSVCWIRSSPLFLLLMDKVLIGFKLPGHEIGSSNSRSV
jgi:hypothetical protein